MENVYVYEASLQKFSFQPRIYMNHSPEKCTFLKKLGEKPSINAPSLIKSVQSFKYFIRKFEKIVKSSFGLLVLSKFDMSIFQNQVNRIFVEVEKQVTINYSYAHTIYSRKKMIQSTNDNIK